MVRSIRDLSSKDESLVSTGVQNFVQLNIRSKKKKHPVTKEAKSQAVFGKKNKKRASRLENTLS